MSKANENIIKDLYAKFGEVVLLPIPLKEKGPKFEGWNKVTFKQSMGIQYQWSLKEVAKRGGNLGVLLGGGLVTIDFDDPADIEPFEEKFPWAKNTTTTVGAKGCQKWFRIKGQYPEERIILKQKEGQATLEFRGGGGHQSVCYGVHKNGKDVYKFVVDVPPKEIEWEEIRPWIESFAPEAGHSADHSGGNGNGSKPPGQDEDWSWLKKFPIKVEIRELDLRGLLEELGIASVATGDPTMFAVRCPWQGEHSSDTGSKQTVIYQWPEIWFPAFDCKHAHCAHRKLRAVVEWAEDLRPGIVKRYCGKSSFLPGSKDLKQSLENPLKLPEEVIKKLLHQGLKMMIAGPSKLRKSWLATDLALSLAVGMPWLGFDTVSSRVLYLNLEIPEPFYVKRAGSITQAKGVMPEAGMFTMMHLRGFDLGEPTVWNELIKRAVKGGPYGVIFIDPNYKLLGERDENSATDVAALVKDIDRLAEATGASAIQVHHFSKGNQAAKDAGDRASGSGVWFRDTDVYMSLTRLTPVDTYRIDIVARNVPPIDPFAVQWEFPVWQRAVNVDVNDLYKPGKKEQPKGETPQPHHAETMLELLKMSPQGLTHTEWKTMALAAGVKTPSSFQYGLDKLNSEKPKRIKQINKKYYAK